MPDIIETFLQEAVILVTEGVQGLPGPAGDGAGSGEPGKSAYELAVEQGYGGTLDEWLASLKGESYTPATPDALTEIMVPDSFMLQGVQDGQAVEVSVTALTDSLDLGRRHVAVTDAPVTTVLAQPDNAMFMVDDGGAQKRITPENLFKQYGQSSEQLTQATSMLDSDILFLNRGGTEMTITAAAARAYFVGNAATPDTTAPAFVSAAISNATPNKITVTFDETLAVTPDIAAWTISGGRTVTLVERSGATIILTANTAYVYGDIVTVAYTKQVTNMLQDAAGNQTATFAAKPVTNNIAAPAGTPATAVTMTGPTGGAVSVASTNFTVGVSPVGGTITGTVVVTPSDNAGGGTFAPTSISLTSAAPTGTFTYTPSATAGARTISVTNNGGLANPANITYTSTAPATVVDYTITGNLVSGSPNKPYATVSASSVDADYGTKKRWAPAKQSPSLYYTITPTPASALSGWSNSNTVPPAAAVVNSSGSSVNGYLAMSNPSSWGNTVNLYGAVGERWYFWIKPVDGAWFCVDTAGTLVVA